MSRVWWGGLLSMALFGAGIAQAQTAAPAGEAADRQYATAAALQNREQFDLAADEWSQFAKKFPSDQRVGFARSYLGLCQFKADQFAAAAQTFEALLADAPKLPPAALKLELADGSSADLLEQTYLYLGLAQFKQASAAALKPAERAPLYQRAAATFAALAAKYPQGKYASSALFYQAEVAYALDQKPQAIGWYQQLVQRFPQDPLAAKAQYGLGVAQAEAGQAAAAAATFTAFLKSFPTSELAPEVRMRAGDAMLASGQPDQAQPLLAAAVAEPGFALADYATMRLAVSFYDRKQFRDAAGVYAALPQKFPKSTYQAEAWLNAGKCYYLADQFADAAAALAKARAAGGKTALDADHWLAQSYLKQKQPAEAVRLLDAAIAGAGGDPAVVQLELDRADSLYDVPGQRKQAAAAYRELATRHPDDELAPQALYLAAFTFKDLGDYSAALAETKAFLARYGKHELAPDVMVVAAECNLAQGNPGLAAQVYADLLSKYGSHADAAGWKVRRALALVLDKKSSEAVQTIEPLVKSLTANPRLLAEAHYVLGLAYSDLKQFDRAAAALEASLKDDPKYNDADEVLLALSKSYRALNRPADAKAPLARLLKEFPDSANRGRAHLGLGELAAAAGDFRQAADEYRQVTEQSGKGPLVPYALLELAAAQAQQKDYAGAVETLDRLLAGYATDPLAPRAYYSRGIARHELKEYRGAIADMQAFLKTNPPQADRSDAYYELGLSQEAQGLAADAVDTFRKLLKDDPQYARADRVEYELAWTLKSLGKEADAAEAFGRLASDRPKSPLAAESLYYVGEAYYGKQDFAKATKAYYDAMQKAGKSELGENSAYKLGWAYFRNGEYDNARQTFVFQRGTFPNGPLASDAAYMEGESLFKQQKFKDALDAYALVKQPKRPEIVPLALLHSGQAAGQLKQWDRSLQLLAEAEKRFPDSEYLPQMLYEEAWGEQNLGHSDKATSLYETVTAKTDNEVAARARFMIGEIQFEKKNHAEAIRNFFKVAYGYNGFPEWQGAAQYEAGRCFEVLGKVDQARRSYQEVVDKFPESSKVGLAKDRLAALGK